MSTEKVIASIRQANKELVESIGFFALLEKKYQVTQATFSNPMTQDVILGFDEARKMFGISFLYAILNGKTAWSVYTGNIELVKAGFKPSDI